MKDRNILPHHHDKDAISMLVAHLCGWHDFQPHELTWREPKERQGIHSSDHDAMPDDTGALVHGSFWRGDRG